MRNLYQAFFHALDQIAVKIGFEPGHADADALLSIALRRAGRRDFSDRSFLPALQRLLDAYDEEARLSVFGMMAARFDTLRSLHNILRFDTAEETNPDVVTRAIAEPIFITGLPRSGTTFMHTLLSLDSANAVPRTWQLLYPYPLKRNARQADIRPRRVERQLNLFRHLSPGLAGMHQLSADAPQECTDITAQVFQSLRFDTTYRIPSYQRWLDAQGHHAAYLFHRRFLQHLDAQFPGKRWVLKCPDHIFALDALLSAYPDARILFLHRDPLRVLASVAKLTELLRRPFTRLIDREEIGRQVSARWADGADKMAAAATGLRSPRILHMRYSDLISRPMDSVALLYRRFGLVLSDEARQCMTAYLTKQPRGGYSVHRHSLDEFGLDPVRLRARFARYMEIYQISPEGPGWDGALSYSRSAA